MKLKAVCQVVPNIKGIEAPSRIEDPIEISASEFARGFADSARASEVSFDTDGISNPQSVTTYTGSNPMTGRFIIESV